MAAGENQEGPARLTPRDLQHRALNGAVWTMAHTVLSLPLAFGVNIVLARVLGVVDYGRLALLTTLLELAGLVAGAGVSAALIQFGAKAHADGRPTEVADLLMRTQGFRLLVLAPAITALVVLVADVPPWLLLSAVVFGVWLPAFTGGAAVCMTIENRTATGARVAMGLNLVAQATVLGTVLATSSPDMVWNARMMVGGLGPLVSLLLISRLYRGAVLRPRWPGRMPPGFWKFALPVGLSGVVTNLALSRSEVLLLEQLSTPAELGLYAMAFGLAVHLLAPAQAVINPLIPAVSGLRETAIDRVGAAFLKTSRITATMAGLIGAAAAPALALLVPVLYGEDFAAAAPLVLVLTFVTSLIFLQSPMTPFVSARLRGVSILRINVISLLAGVAIGLPLISFLGAWGAVLGKVAITVTRHVLLLTTERESFAVSRRTALRSSLPAALGVSAGAAAYFLLTPVLNGLSLAAVPLVGSVTYLAGLRLLRTGLSAGDRELLLGVVARVPRLTRPTDRLLRLMAHAR